MYLIELNNTTRLNKKEKKVEQKSKKKKKSKLIIFFEKVKQYNKVEQKWRIEKVKQYNKVEQKERGQKMKDIEVMRSAIIEAVNKNDVSKRDLGNVTTINKIIEGLEVKFDAIKLAYSRLPMAREKRKERDPAKVKYGKAKVKQYNKVEQNEKAKVENEKIKDKWEEKKVEQKVKQNIDEKVKQYNKVEQNEKQSNADNSEVKQESKTIQQNHDSLKVEQYKERIMSEIEDLKSTVNELRAEIESLKATVSNLSSNKPAKPIIKEQKSVANIVMGFSIRIENTWTQGNRYEKYYAVKRIAGKLHRIYIGKDSSEAEEKIKAYCEKKGILI